MLSSPMRGLHHVALVLSVVRGVARIIIQIKGRCRNVDMDEVLDVADAETMLVM